MKFISTIIAGVIVGAFGVYLTLDWQEEKLKFSITSPAKFGDINYQNISITNTGWNPAVNLKLYISHPDIKFSNVQSSTSLKNISNEKNGIAGFERIRRDETINISLAYEGQPLFGTEVKVASDRSIAEQIESEGKDSNIDWAFFVFVFMAVSFFIGIISSIAIPAYQGYIKQANAAAAKLGK